MTEPLCKAPFIAIRYSSYGTISPCCWMKDFNSIKSKDTKQEEYWNNSKVKNIRKQLLENKLPKECKICATSKDTIGTNRIRYFNKTFQDFNADAITEFSKDQPFAPLQMDINFSNVCNLKCRHCSSYNSSSWVKDDKVLNKVSKKLGRTMAPVNYNNTDLLIREEAFQSVRIIDFKGGEPMMQDEMYTLLQKLIDWDLAKKITLNYTTNGTKNCDSVKHLWSHFKKVICNFSIEATGNLFSYIRGGEHYTLKEFTDNYLSYSNLEICEVEFANTVMIYNLFNLPELVNYMERIQKYKKVNEDYKNTFTFRNMVLRPEYLNYRIMPKKLKEKLINYYDKFDYKCINDIKQGLINNLDYYDETNWNLFLLYTKDLDKIRNTNLVDIVPEFEEFLK